MKKVIVTSLDGVNVRLSGRRERKRKQKVYITKMKVILHKRLGTGYIYTCRESKGVRE